MVIKMKEISFSERYRKFKFRRKNRSLAMDIILFLFIGFFAVFSLWPLVLIANNAFKPLNEIFLFPPKLFVINPTTDNFTDLKIIVSNSWIPLSRYVFNTLFITVAGTIGSVIISSLAAFPLAKFKFPGSSAIFQVILYALLFNTAVLATPTYIIMAYLGLLDTYASILLPIFGGTLGVFLLKNFMEQIPDALIEAATIDGANDFRIYRSVIMPVCKPAWITLVILSFQSFWGATGGTYIYSESKKPLTFAVSQIVNSGVSRTGVASAVSFIMLIVPVVFFIFAQGNVMQTMASSGIKE